MINPDIRVLPTSDDVAHTATILFADHARAAIRARGCFHICLAGGSTPHHTYTVLADSPTYGIDWPNVHIYFGDERCVSHDHPDSNHRMAADTLLTRVDLSPDHIHPIPTDLDPATAADRYERTLHTHLAPAANRFDLVLLGIGDDAHTASLFPDTPALDVIDRWCVVNTAPKPPRQRITLTYPVFNTARCLVFLVTGQSKAHAVRSIFTDPIDPHQRPAQGIQPSRGNLIWLIDHAAASSLPPDFIADYA